MKRFLYFVIVIIVIAIAAFMFAVRPVEAPPAEAPTGDVSFTFLKK